MPPYAGFCGSSNPSQSVLADAERTKNLYVEAIESKAAPTGAALYPCPGFQNFVGVAQGITDIGTRAAFAMYGECYVVIGTGFYEVFANKTVTRRGTVAVDSNPATISSNGVVAKQLGITSGGNWYTFDRTTKAFAQVAALNGKATQGGSKDEYFLCFDVNSGSVFVSNIRDGLTFNTGTMFFGRSIAPDPARAMVVANPQIYILGEQTTEAWYNAGNSPQPFAPILSSFMQYGTPAPFAAGMAEDALIFLSRDRSGQGIVIAARSYVPQALSNYAVETAIQGYARTAINGITDTELMIYQDQGHLFTIFGFPGGDATWCADPKAGGLWHERTVFDAVTGLEHAWKPRAHCSAFGLHLVGDRSTGNINAMDVTYGSEADGSVIRRVRVGPPLWASSAQRLQIDRFQLQIETGVGTPTGQGVNPKVMLRTSVDGKTWGHERQCGFGAQGQYRTRVFFNRCGSSTKLWVPEIVITDPVPVRISGAEIQGRGFSQISSQAAA